MNNPLHLQGPQPVKIFIAMLCGSGSIKADTVISLIMTTQFFLQNRIPYEYNFLQGITGVDSARNINAHMFMQTDCTHMLMIDDDMAWAADLPFRLWLEDVDIVGVPYRTKVTKDERWTARHTEGPQHCMGSDKLYMMKMNALGTGMLLVKRGVFERMNKTVEKASMGDDDKQVAMYFRHTIKNGKMRSEDFSFCDLAKDAGFNIWAYVDEEIAHIGNYAYTGNYADKLDTDDTKFRYDGKRMPLKVMLK